MKYYTAFYVFAVGLMIGSFLNVCIYRIPKNMKFAFDRSRCTTCGKELRCVDLIPVISYMSTKGKCRYCGEKISTQYPTVELTNALLYLYAYFYYQTFSPNFIISCVLISVLIVISVIDFQTMEIFDRFHAIILFLGLFYVIINKAPLAEHIAGAFAVSLPMLIISLMFNGFGGGDIKLMFACGFLLAWQNIFVAMILACLFGSVYGVIFKLKSKTYIPFGPFLAAGILISYFFGEKLISLYLNLAGIV